MNKITKNGVYDIEIDRYHNDPHLCDGPSISSSGLRTLLLECPARYWAFSPYNPNRFPDESTKALDVGRAAHCLVLGEPEFNAHFIISPYDEFRSKESRAWRDEQTRTVLKAEDFELVKILAEVQRRSAQAMRAFQDGKPEVSLIWKDEETGIWLKARPDWLPNKPQERFIVEFKSALSLDPRRWAASAFGFGYHMQAALQIDGVKACMGVDPIGVAHCVQEKDPPYLCELRLFQPDHIEWGRKQYRRALKLFAHCMKTGEWPGWTSEPTYTETPYYIARDMDAGWTDNFGKLTGDDNGNGSAESDEAKRERYTAADYVGAG